MSPSQLRPRNIVSPRDQGNCPFSPILKNAYKQEVPEETEDWHSAGSLSIRLTLNEFESQQVENILDPQLPPALVKSARQGWLKHGWLPKNEVNK